MISALKNKNSMSDCLSKKFLIQKVFYIKRTFLCNSSLNNNCYLKGAKSNRFKNIFCSKKEKIHIDYAKNSKGYKESYKENKKSNYEDQQSKKLMYYPESNSLPYATICIVLGMIGFSVFFKFSIYNLRNCNTEESLLLHIDKIVNYLDKYFVISNYEENQNNIDKINIFNLKYLTSQFFTNENILQCSVQLFTFFLASSFIERYYGSLKFLTLFLSASFFSNIISFYFFKCIKKIESLSFIDFVLIHSSGSMAFMCALCSIYFKNCSIWKHVPIYCSILIVPYLFSIFYGMMSFYKIKKLNSTNESKNSDTNTYKNVQLKNKEIILDNKLEEDVLSSNTVTKKIYYNEKKHEHNVYKKNKENTYHSNVIKDNKNEALDTLKNFLVVNACDSIIQKNKKEGMFSNKKILNLKKEASKNLNEINKSQKIFFGLSSSFTDIFGVILASAASFFLKIMK